MNPTPSGSDPIVRALDELVRTGQIPPERARAAYEGSLGRTAPTPPAGEQPPTPGAEPDRQVRLETFAIAVGVGLLTATVWIATSFSRQESDLDWSNYALGIVASLGLLGVAAGALVLVKDDKRKANLAAWPGALGAIGVGMMIAVGLEDNPATGYVAGVATVLLAAAGYYVVRRGAFVLAAIVGLFTVYVSLFDDLVDITDIGGDNSPLTAAAAMLVFAVAITAAGWKLPERDLAGVFVGALTVAVYASVLAGIAVTAAFARAFAPIGTDLGTGSDFSIPDPNRFDNDVYLTLLFAAILVAGWAVCAVLSGHVGYRVLVLLMVATAVPLAVLALAVEHPSYWSLGAGVVGAVVLGIIGLRALGVIGDFGRKPPLRPSGGGPVNLDGPR